jgi:hypothetical protein
MSVSFRGVAKLARSIVILIKVVVVGEASPRARRARSANGGMMNKSGLRSIVGVSWAL